MATIDALGLAEDFETAGFSRDQALGMARAIRDHLHSTLITKADLRELELRLEARLAQLETRIEQKLADVQIGLIKWFTGLMIAQGAVIVALSAPPAPPAQPPAPFAQPKATSAVRALYRLFA